MDFLMLTSMNVRIPVNLCLYHSNQYRQSMYRMTSSPVPKFPPAIFPWSQHTLGYLRFSEDDKMLSSTKSMFKHSVIEL